MNRNASDLGAHFLPAPLNGGFAMEGYWVWCGSVARGEDGLYHMFASRWKNSLPFHPGWGVASEIVRAVSTTPEGPYRFAGVVLGPRGAGWWDGRVAHNPVIQKCGDTWLLFYMGTTHPYPDPPGDGSLNHDSYQWLCARAHKRIGLATAKSILGPWQRPDRPLLDVRPGQFDDFFTSNPAPCLHPDGSCLLLYKTRSWKQPPYTGCTGNGMFSGMKLGAAWADHWRGPYRRLTDRPLFEGEGVLEDPFLWKTDAGYAMIAKDWNGHYTGDAGSAVYASSPDGLDWQVHRRPAFTREILWEDGRRQVMGNLDRPFLLFDEHSEATHLFAAANDGSEAGFKTMTRSWNLCIPLR